MNLQRNKTNNIGSAHKIDMGGGGVTQVAAYKVRGPRAVHLFCTG